MIGLSEVELHIGDSLDVFIAVKLSAVVGGDGLEVIGVLSDQPPGVLARYIHAAVATTVPGASATSLSTEYDAAIERLTAAGWRAQVEE